MIIKAKHHIIIYPLFKWLTLLLLKIRFNDVKIIGDFKNEEKSALLICNHISWWDGFWLMYLNLKLIHHKFHFMMLEEQLKKHWYFQFSGGYSVKKKNRSIIESLNYTIALLKKPENMVFMFPQGKIQSLYNRQIVFEKGIQKIIEKSSNDVQVVFVANMIDYFSNPKPNLYMYIKTYSAQQLKQCSIESEYTMFYNSTLNKQKHKSS